MDWYEAIRSAINAASRLQSADLLQRLADVQLEGAKLAQDNARLRDEVAFLKQQARLDESMAFRDNGYWLQRSGRGEEGPFCSKCWDGDGKAVRMLEPPNNDHWSCPVCRLMTDKPGRGLGRIATFVTPPFNPVT